MAEEKFDWTENLNEMNKELEERILEANEDKTLVKWSHILPDFMMSEVLMVGQFSGMKTESGENALGILMLRKDGKTVVPFFTSPERIKALATPENNKFEVLRINTARFFKSIKGQNAVLNPFSKYSREFSPFDVKILAAEYIDKAPPVEKKSAASEQSE